MSTALRKTRKELGFEPSASFPSGHAMVSGAAMGIGLAIIAGRLWPERNRLALIIGTIYAVAMALSRIPKVPPSQRRRRGSQYRVSTSHEFWPPHSLG